MRVAATALPGVLLIESAVFRDARGFFLESWRRDRFAAAGLPDDFVQDNHSRSVRGTLRGLHYQVGTPQGKLVRVVRGSVYDVVVDVRRSSASFGKWIGVELTDAAPRSLWIPPGYAHGFYVTSEIADLEYKCTTLWSPEGDRVLRWDDAALGIAWPLLGKTPPLVSEKDATAPSLAVAECLP